MSVPGVAHHCCDAFATAQHSGTDNEGYEPLVFVDNGIDGHEGRIKIGSGLPPIEFCPWCSAPITQGKEAKK